MSLSAPHDEEPTGAGRDRFEQLLPLAGVAAALLFVAGLALTWGDPSSETGPAKTFSYWAENRGRHQISGLLLAPLIAFVLLFFGTALRRRLRSPDGAETAYGSVAFGGAVLAAGTFALVGMLEGAATNAAHEGQRESVYTLSQLHSYDWVA
jgi:drug/metabolite transporter (DMT)-like permease